MDNFKLNSETISALNAIGENIFIADSNFDIVWINNYSGNLIKKLSRFVPIKTSKDLIGMNIDKFHLNPSKQIDILTNQLPHRAKINLFNAYTADIEVDAFKTSEGQTYYIVTWKDVTEYEEDKKIIELLSTPIIEISLEGALLIPIAGPLSSERIKTMTSTILEECADRGTSNIIIDFTGINNKIDEHIAFELEVLTKSLGLMGVEVVYTGFPIDVVKTLVYAKIDLSVKSFGNLKQGAEYILTKLGYTVKRN